MFEGEGEIAFPLPVSRRTGIIGDHRRATLPARSDARGDQ
jgi:hypothetical protein